MDTPGRCMNTDTCWIGNAGRTVRVVLGAEFICPGCQAPLLPPAPRRASMRRVLRLGVCIMGITLVLGGAGLVVSGFAGSTAVTRVLAQIHGPNPDLASLKFGGTAQRISPAPTGSVRDLASRLESAPSPVRASFQSYQVVVESRPWEAAATALGHRAPPDSARHSWAEPPKPPQIVPNGMGWVADAGPEWHPSDPARNAAADAISVRPASPGTDIERAPLIVSNELAVVPPPKPDIGTITTQPAVAVQPPALFGRIKDVAHEPPAALLADLDSSTGLQDASADPVSFGVRGTARAAREAARPHTKLRDALREAFGTDTEHVSLPAGAAPVLPRYPALFAQEYPAGRVTAVCLVAARNSSPDCKVLGTGPSLSLTQSVGDWPKAGLVHYKAIAANPVRAAAVWKPTHGHAAVGPKAAG